MATHAWRELHLKCQDRHHRWSGQWPLAAVLVLLVVVAIPFSSLTVEVSDNELRWHFGPGFWAYWLALGDIQTVAAVRNHWWNGFGIRIGAGLKSAAHVR